MSRLLRENAWREVIQPHHDPLAEPVEWARFDEPQGGKMFGLLLCEDEQGARYVLRAFSGQLQGAWLREGWAPPLFDEREVAQASWETQTALHLINRALVEGELSVEERQALKRARKARSQALTHKLRAAYTLKRRDEEGELTHRSLSEQWPTAPLGAGDCCAPKLLNLAATHKLTPLCLVEMWWGAPTSEFSPGLCYPPCADRCGPILGFWLGQT